MPVADCVERMRADCHAIQPKINGPAKPTSQRTGSPINIAESAAPRNSADVTSPTRTTAPGGGAATRSTVTSDAVSSTVSRIASTRPPGAFSSENDTEPRNAATIAAINNERIVQLTI